MSSKRPRESKSDEYDSKRLRTLSSYRSNPFQQAGNRFGRSSFKFPSKRLSKETGYRDSYYPALPLTTVNQATNLINIVPQGAASIERVGKKIMMQSVAVKAVLAAGSAATINAWSIYLIYDKRPTGTLPSTSDVFLMLSGAYSMLAMPNEDNAERFKIIRKWNGILTGNTTSPSTGVETALVDTVVPLRLPTVYKSLATGDIGDIEVGSLLVVGLGSNAAGAGAAIFNLSTRVKFVDQ